MWFLFTLLTFIAWGVADLFYKKGSRKDDAFSHLKIICAVGFVMGLHAALYIIHMAQNGTGYQPFDIIRYLPVSFMYILSMALGYFGLRYIELSVSSPVQNSSGAVTALLLVIFFKISLDKLEIAGLVLIFAGVLGLSITEKLYGDRERRKLGIKDDKKYTLSTIAIIFPILYCIIDGLGTFADGVYLDELSLISEDSALVSYELTFFICAVFAYVFLRFIKKERFTFSREKTKLFAALFETAGQFFYVFAMSGRAVVAAPVIASYCVLSVLLSRIFLKEKLSLWQYLTIAVVFSGIFLLGLAEGLAD